MKNLMRNMSTVVASLALIITSGMVNSVCHIFLYQPELPEGADALRKR